MGSRAMATTDSIAEAFARVADSLGRLVVQHLELARVEIESEARELTHRARTGAAALARALPFAVAGLVLASWGMAELAARALAPGFGSFARPVSFVGLGLAEALLAAAWLKRALAAAPAKPTTPERPENSSARQAAPQSAGDAASDRRKRSAPDGGEMRYGAMGRA